MKKEDVDAENPSMFDLKQNYFELLNIPQQFEIDKEQLYKNYIKLQQLFHPDKLVNKSNAEKILGLEYAANINNIYQILNDDKRRAEYLLLLRGIIVNTDDNNIKPDPLMLAEILEFSENPDPKLIEMQIKECWKIFIESFPQDLQKAAQTIIKLQYLSKI
jgi:Fe-S protein assembly co-chaperone HscB